MPRINHQKLRRSLEAARKDKKPQRFFADFRDALEKGQLKPAEFSVRQLFENFVENGRELVESWNPNHGGGYAVQALEAAGAVDTSAFSNITGQIMFTRVLEAFNDPALIWQQLVDVIPTQFNGEKIPGIGRIGDEAQSIQEGHDYPLAGVSEEWIETPTTTKRGFIVPVTKEALFFDRTGILLKRAAEVATWLAVNIEKRVLDMVFGITNSYKRNGTAYDTYQATSPWVNIKATNALADYTDVENALLLFDALTDPNTGEPIIVNPNTMVVPSALNMTARRVLNSTEIRVGDGASASVQTISANPLNGQSINVLSNAYVKSRTSSDSTWFIGDFKGAFAYMQNWPVSVVQAPSNSHDEFHRDIVSQYKVSERGTPAVLEPRKTVKCTA